MNFYRTLRSLCVAVCALALSAGCGKEATIDNINDSKSDLKESLGQVNTEADETTENIESAYTQLKTALDEMNLSDESIKLLEANLESMKSKYDDLKSALDDSKDNAEDLFDMLMRRAEENQTYKEKMVASIEEKQKQLAAKMDAANEVMEKIEKSIQKYDDIVGYFQVEKGLDGIDGYITDAEEAIKAGNILNEEIKSHINDGLDLVGAL